MRASSSKDKQAASYPFFVPESFRRAILSHERGKAGAVFQKLRKNRLFNEYQLWLRLWELAQRLILIKGKWQPPPGITPVTLARRADKLRGWAEELSQLKTQLRSSCAERGFSFDDDSSEDTVKLLRRDATCLDILRDAARYYSKTVKHGVEESQQELIHALIEQTGRPHHGEAAMLIKAAYSAAGIEIDISSDALRMRSKPRRSNKK